MLPTVLSESLFSLNLQLHHLSQQEIHFAKHNRKGHIVCQLFIVVHLKQVNAKCLWRSLVL